ncbi:MAG: HipA domain-containing protein [Candidatus Sabulitectum sp.]|nr:HipA domain-containing protein [Candidatus Sabulitectum sp.]
MADSAFVYIDINGKTILVGRLWTHIRGRRESATFEYSSSWLRSPTCFALEPALSTEEGSHHTRIGKNIFGAIGDSAPDRWGRMLMRRASRKEDRETGRTPRTLREIDYLLKVNDVARMGALRFSEIEGGAFLAQRNVSSIPPMIELPRLLAASDSLLRDQESDEELRILLVPGSSLGGAQPKASICDNESQLFIAKFPNNTDDYNRIAWEAVALDLAEQSGIKVPQRRLELINGKHVLILKRFDRERSIRIPFLSGMSMISARDNETSSYLELVDAIRGHGATPLKDMHELWRRIVITILISNVDDHMRNHGFLYDGRSGWILSPAYDLNPTPVDIAPRILSSAIDIDDQTASLDLALEVADYFEIDLKMAKEYIREIARAVSNWKNRARAYGISSYEIDRMSSAFEHEDLQKALKI